MNSPVDTSTAKSYLDFSGLSSLRAKAEGNQDAAIKETAQQFEGMFIQMMMKSMREANSAFKDENHEDTARATFEDMFDKEASVQMAKRNSLGVADFLTRAIKQHTPTATADVLKSREKQQGLPLKASDAAPMSLQQTEQQGLPLNRTSTVKTLRELKQGMQLRSGS